MLDIQLLRNDLPGVAARLKARGYLLEANGLLYLPTNRPARIEKIIALQAGDALDLPKKPQEH